MNVPLRIMLVYALFSLATGCAAQGPVQRMNDLSCSDEPHCQVVVTIQCKHFIDCDASIDHEGVNAHGNNVFWTIADDDTSRKFSFDPYTGIEFKTAEGRKAFECMPVGPRFKCRNIPDARADKYYYSVKVVGVPRIDPWVVNH